MSESHENQKLNNAKILKVFLRFQKKFITSFLLN